MLPPRIAFQRHAGGADHLIRGQVERHVERSELAVELTRRIQRVRFPAVAVVDHDLGIPLREIEAPALAALAARQGRGARLPVYFDHQ